MTAVGMLEEKLLLQKWGRKQAEGSHWTRPVEWSELWEETGMRRTREGQADQEDPPSSQKHLYGYIGIRLGERKQKPRPWAGEAQGRGRGEKCWEEPPVGTEWDLSWVPLRPGHLYCKPLVFVKLSVLCVLVMQRIVTPVCVQLCAQSHLGLTNYPKLDTIISYRWNNSLEKAFKKKNLAQIYTMKSVWGNIWARVCDRALVLGHVTLHPHSDVRSLAAKTVSTF